jgi:hypothetical protein
MPSIHSYPKNPPSDTSVSDIEDRSADIGDAGRPEHAIKDAKFCTPCRCIVMSVILCAAVVVSASLILTDSPNPLDYFMVPDPPGADAATRWDATAGLYLRVENACDGNWTDIVEQSILAWNASEAVVLTLEPVEYDMECSPVNGRLKVCNGDYGETPWKGINLMVVDAYTDMAIHSVSKFNDRYLTRDDERLYIACHENGHGKFCVRNYLQQLPTDDAMVWVWDAWQCTHLWYSHQGRNNFLHFFLPLVMNINQDSDSPTPTRTFTTEIAGIAWTTPPIPVETTSPGTTT